jgi:hypothetical protein
MNTKIIKNIWISLTFCFLLASCCYDGQVLTEKDTEGFSPIPEFFGKNIVMATGIDFQTGKSVVLNPTTGQVIKPCSNQQDILNPNDPTGQTITKQRNISQYRGVPPDNEDCNTQIIEASPEVLNAIKSSQNISNGTVRKNGKDIPARFVISVATLYKGSDCISYTSLGNRVVVCTTLLAQCNASLPLTRYGVRPELTRKLIRKTCRQFAAWKNSDCTNLRPEYKKAWLNYTKPYQREVYDSCRFQGASWDPRP